MIFKILSRFDLDAGSSKMDFQIWFILIFIWLVVMGCAIGSVFALGQRVTPRQRWGWITLIVCVPVLGLLIYLPFSVMREGLSPLKQTKGMQKKISGAS